MDSTTSAGLVLGSRFVLERRLAVGGMGQVWRATDQVLGRPVAVKILRRDLTESDDFLTRFRSEARLAASLSHPGIAHVYDYAEDVCDDARVAYLVMEYVAGQPLSTRLAHQNHLDDPLDPALVVSILRQTAEAVGAAHEAGIVHRDIKPGNLMITTDGRVKVTDFGIARAMSEAAVTEIGEVIGTVRYMSPEQAVGEEATPASDVYSLAVVGYEMLAARAPFTGDSPAAIALAHVQTPPPELPASVPDELRSLIGQSLAKLPQQRPSDGAEFAAALRDMSISEAPATVSIAAAASGTTPTIEMSPTAVLPVSPTPLDSAPHNVDDLTQIGPTIPPVSEMRLLGDGWVDARRRRRRVAAWATTVAVTALVLLLIVVNRSDGPSGNVSAADSIAAGTTAAPPATSAAMVTIDPAAYRGLNEAEARAALAAAGLTATTTSAASTADLSGLVIDVQPSGVVAVGSSVTITLGDGTLTPAAEPPPAENPAGGNGNGKDKPKDRGRGNGND